METYRKSILEYADVRSAVDLAREEALEEGREEGAGIMKRSSSFKDASSGICLLKISST